jgi:hypothetical protein
MNRHLGHGVPNPKGKCGHESHCLIERDVGSVSQRWLPHKILTMRLSLAPFSCLLACAAAQDLLTLNVYAVNAPSNALATVAADASTYYTVLLDAEPSNYIWIEPGEAIPESRMLERRSESYRGGG